MNTNSSDPVSNGPTPDRPRTTLDMATRQTGKSNTAPVAPEVAAHKANAAARGERAQIAIWGDEVWVWTGTCYRVAMVSERELAQELAAEYAARRTRST